MDSRYSEFDFLGVIGTVVGSAALADARAFVAAAGAPRRLADTFATKNRVSLAIIPAVFRVGMTIVYERSWAWPVLLHQATAFGLLCGSAGALQIGKTQLRNKCPQQNQDPPTG